MTNAEQIAALERTLADVENGISLIEARLAAGGPGSAGLTATLANLRARRTALQFQIANLRAAGVTVAPLAAPAAAPVAAAAAGAGAPRGAAPRAAAARTAAAPLPPKALLAFARNLDRFAKATLDVIGGKPAATRRASTSKAAKGSKTSKKSKAAKTKKTAKKR